MSPDPAVSAPTRIGRALRRRCPRCGAEAYDAYFTMKERCVDCGLRFEREEGYWVGALIINTAVTFGTFIVVFLTGILATWPDVPWTVVGTVTIAVNAIIPIAFYPISKTLWLALEMGWHPLEDEEIAEAARFADRG